MRARSFCRLGLIVLCCQIIVGCGTLREIANLRNVHFGLDALTGLEIAGVDLAGVRTYEDLTAVDLLKIGASVARNELPLSFTLDVLAENPAENGVQARLVRFDWTLLLDDRETISGVFEDEIVIPSGDSRHFPVHIHLDLIEFFDRNSRDIVNLALSLVGQGGQPQNVHLRATPTISTALGPIRYPEPITVISTTVG